MNKQLVNFIVKKYLKFDKKNPFISISAILAFVGVAIGVMVLIITMAIMNGTAKEFEKKLFTMNYPISIYPKYINSVDEDLLIKLEQKFPKLQFSPYLTSQVIIQNGESMGGGVIFGVNPKKEAAINSIYKESYEQNPNLRKYDVILGKGIKESLFLMNEDKVTLYFTSLNPSGLSLLPKMKRFTYKNYFTSGLHAYDKAYIYTSLEALQTLLKKPNGAYDGIHVYSDNAMEDIKEIKAFIDNDGAGAVGWWQQNGNFFAAMELEKRALLIVLMLIILVASLNIISSLLMTVMTRRKEIALLLSMGASEKEIKSIFLRLGSIIGISGIIVGIGLGFAGMWILETFDIITLPADVYGFSKPPFELSTMDFLSIVFGSLIIVLISSYYPAKKATNIDVIDVLRNE